MASDQTRRKEEIEALIREILPTIPIESLKKDRLITLKSAAKILGVCEKTVTNRLTQGHFRFVKDVGKVKIWENSIYEYLQRLTAVAELEAGYTKDLWKNEEK